MANELDKTILYIYFQEIESREKILNRLRLNFAAYASVVALLSYMLRMLDYESNCQVIVLFFVGIFSGTLLLIKSVYLSVSSWTGFKYRVLPEAGLLIKYRNDLILSKKEIEEYNKNYGTEIDVPKPDKSVNSFISRSIAECVDHNENINEYRRKAVRNSVWYMVISAIPIIISSLFFVIFDLDVSSPRKSLLIEDRELSLKVSELESAIRSTNCINNHSSRGYSHGR